MRTSFDVYFKLKAVETAEIWSKEATPHDHSNNVLIMLLAFSCFNHEFLPDKWSPDRLVYIYDGR